MEIRQVTDKDIASYARCIGSVAKEEKYLLLTSAPSIDVITEFITDTIMHDYIFLVALINNEVIGWCDIRPYINPGRDHIGILGMGVISEHRGKGIGKALLEEGLKLSKDCGLEALHLEVFSSNKIAIKLYEKYGFNEDGLKLQARKFKNSYEDILLMTKFL